VLEEDGNKISHMLLRQGKFLVKPLGEIIDLVWLKSQGYGFFYDQHSKSVQLFDQSFQKYQSFLTQELFPIQGKLLRTDSLESNLFIRTGDNEISAIFGLKASPLSSSVNRFRGTYGGPVADFRPFDINKLYTVSLDGYISIFQNLAEAARPQTNLFQIALKEGEIVCASNICKRDTFVAVATRIGDRACRLLIFAFDNDFRLHKQAELDLHKYSWSESSGSFFNDLSLDFYVHDFPLVLGFQRFGDNLMIPFLVNGAVVEKFKAPIVYHEDNFGKCVYFKDGVWSVDGSGGIKRVSLIV
jgi:hypothetical protein